MSQKYLDVTGKTVEEAVASALTQLETDRDNVNVEILEKSKNGFLGIGAAPAKIRVYYEVSKIDKTNEFLSELFRLMKIDSTAKAEEGEAKQINVTLSGSDMGLVIGRRGENLDALQYITNLAVNKGEEERVHINIDTENYRTKREDSLIKLARRIAEKVVKYHKSVTLESMPPSERRIVHSSLQDFSGVTTFSTGKDPNRRVIIAPAGLQGTKKKPQA